MNNKKTALTNKASELSPANNIAPEDGEASGHRLWNKQLITGQARIKEEAQKSSRKKHGQELQADLITVDPFRHQKSKA